MKGGEFPTTTHTQPWNTQFELYVAAMLVHGGLEVTPGEPDLRLLYGYEKVGIAAKRLTSTDPDQASRHVKKAVQQIESTGLRGWIALNLDSRFAHVQLRDEKSRILDDFTAVFESVTHAIQEHSRNNQVLGIMLHGFLSEWVEPANDEEPLQLSFSAPFRWEGWVDDDPAQTMLYNNFVNGWRGRASNQLQAIASGRCE